MPKRENIEKFREGRQENLPARQRLGKAHLDQLVRAARRIIEAHPPLEAVRTPEVTHLFLRDRLRWWVGKIDASQEPSDYSDARYFVRPEKVVNSDADDTEQIRTGEQTFPTSDRETVTNLPEVPDDTHVLSDGRRVMVYEFKDESGPRERMFVMAEMPWPCVHGTHSPGGSSPWIGSVHRSDIKGSDISGSPSNSDHYWAAGWNFISDDQRRVNPFVVLDLPKMLCTEESDQIIDSDITGTYSDADVYVAYGDMYRDPDGDYNPVVPIQFTSVVLVSDIRVSDVKLQMMTVQAWVIKYENLGWTTWHTGSDCP